MHCLVQLSGFSLDVSCDLCYLYSLFILNWFLYSFYTTRHIVFWFIFTEYVFFNICFFFFNFEVFKHCLNSLQFLTFIESNWLWFFENSLHHLVVNLVVLLLQILLIFFWRLNLIQNLSWLLLRFLRKSSWHSWNDWFCRCLSRWKSVLPLFYISAIYPRKLDLCYNFRLWNWFLLRLLRFRLRFYWLLRNCSFSLNLKHFLRHFFSLLSLLFFLILFCL